MKPEEPTDASPFTELDRKMYDLGREVGERRGIERAIEALRDVSLNAGLPFAIRVLESIRDAPAGER